MKPKYLLLILLLILTMVGYSQSVKLNASTFDFGKIQQWENQPAQFLFKNTGKSSFFFLPTYAQEDLMMRFEQEEIAPGETGTLLVYYYTQQPGRFKRDFQIYLSTQSKPFSLSIQGEIENLGQNALMQCPEFSQPSTEVLQNKTITFSFYDSLNKSPISQVSGEINHGPKGKTPFQTNQGKFRKELSLGAHGLVVQASGYHPRSGRIWVTKSGKTEYAIALLPLSQKNADTLETVLNTEWANSESNSIQVETTKATSQSIQPQLQSGKRPVKFQAVVVDAKTKMPLKDAKIVLQNEKNRYAFLRTPQNGTVSQTVYAGNYRMQVEKEGYSGYEIPQEISEKAELITIQLMKDEPVNTEPLTSEVVPSAKPVPTPIPVKIKVIESLSRLPIELATITVEGQGYAMRVLETNKKGLASTELIPENYQWKVGKVGYETAYRTKTIGPGNDTLFVELTKVVVAEIPTGKKQVQEVKPKVVSSKNDTEVLSIEKFVPNNIVFLLDVSASMGSNHKLPVMKKAIHRLFEVLRDVDNISVIVYSTSVGVLVPPTPANLKDSILKHIDSLGCSGRTYGQQALETAYRYAESKYIAGGNNQIILATDGIFNNPDLSEEQIYQMVAQKAEGGIPLSVVAFGTDAGAVEFLRKLSKKGGGNFWNIKSNEASVDYLIKEVKKNSKKK
jgi:Ca-activated chloride channel family protein